MDNYFFIRDCNMVNLQTRPFYAIDKIHDEMILNCMEYNKDYDYFYLHDTCNGRIFKYISDKKYEYLLVQEIDGIKRKEYNCFLFADKHKCYLIKSSMQFSNVYNFTYYDCDEQFDNSENIVYYLHRNIFTGNISLKRIVIFGVNIKDFGIVYKSIEFNKKYNCTFSDIIIILQDCDLCINIYNNKILYAYNDIIIDELKDETPTKIITYEKPHIKLTMID